MGGFFHATGPPSYLSFPFLPLFQLPFFSFFLVLPLLLDSVVAEGYNKDEKWAISLERPRIISQRKRGCGTRGEKGRKRWKRMRRGVGWTRGKMKKDVGGEYGEGGNKEK